MKYSVITFGCRVNQADSLGFEEELRAAGARSVPPEQAEVVVVNTCSVTAAADQGARQTIRRVARDNPGARIVVTGCYATRRPNEVRELPNVVRVIPNDDKPRLLPIIRSVRLPPSHEASAAAKASADSSVAFGEGESADRRSLGGGGQADLTTAERFGDGDGGCGAAIEPGVAGRTAFTLRVQTGCAEPCAYCIIPTTRGRPRSVPVDFLIVEAERVTAAGFKEIALTGVHLGSYGRDLSPASSLLELLRRLQDHDFPSARGARHPLLRRGSTPGALGSRLPLARVPALGARGRRRARTRETAAVGGGAPTALKENSLSSRGPQALLFRISSLEPMDCSCEIVDLVAASDRFAPHFHLPLQHASNRVLAAMRRPYTIERYAALVDGIRARVPHASIGSDIIVGFPGETDDDFDELASYLAQSPLTHVHVFPYSDRPGTAASVMSGKIAGSVVRERARRVREIGQQLTKRFRQSQVGAVRPGLTLEDGSLVVTDNYVKVRIPPGRARNEWVMVTITEAGEVMRGEIG